MKLKKSALKLAKNIIQLNQGISPERKLQLENLSDSIRESLHKNGKAEVIVICTHNSRRSHIGQILLKLAALYYRQDAVFTFSGGTEATALNPRVVTALKAHGLKVKKLSDGSNPKYYIPLIKEDNQLDIHFSKPYDCSYNPQDKFVALMVCDHADEACPIVAGATSRVSLPYVDPKLADDTPEESVVYYDKILEIGKEMFYVFSQVGQ